MNWERHLIKYEGKRCEVSALMAPSEFVLDGVFVTKEGHLGCVVRLRTGGFETKNPAELEAISAGFVSSLYNLDPTMRVYQHVFKEPGVGFSGMRDTPRLQYLNRERDKFSLIHTYLTVVYEVEQLKSSSAEEIDRHIAVEAGYLQTVVAGMVGGWRGFSGYVLGADQAFSFLAWLANYEPRLLDKGPSYSFAVNHQMCHSDVDANGALKVGTRFIRILTLNGLPKHSSVFYLRDLLKIQCGMVICTEWKPLGHNTAHSSLRVQRRHAHNSKGSVTSGNRVVDEGMVERDDVLGLAQKEMERGEYLGEFSLTVLLYSEDAAALRKPVDAVHAVIQQRQGALTEQHDKSALVAWLATIPGNQKFSIRSRRLFAVNYGDLSFLFVAATGDPMNQHFKDEALTVLRNVHGAPFYLNLHRGGVGHTLFTGATGTGKTYTLNMIIDCWQKYPRAQTVIFDIMNGFETLTRRLGGTYIQLGRGEGGATINPFAMDPTEENLGFLFAFVRLLVESDHDGQMQNRELLDLDTQIRGLYRLRPDLRRLGNLVLMPQVSERLNRWVTRETSERKRKGQYADLFDNAHDSIQSGNFVTFNFPEMGGTHVEALEALTFYIIHLVNRIVSSSGSAPKLVVMDEAHSLLKTKETREFMAHGLMRWRHHNASAVLATQSPSHLEGAIGDSILEQCGTRIFSANPGVDPAVWVNRFQMSETEALIPAQLKAAGEIQIQGQGVMTVEVDEVSHALYSNGPYHKELRAKLVKEHGLEEGLREMAKL